MTSKIEIKPIPVKLPEWVARDNIVGHVSVRTVATNKLLTKRKFYSVKSRQIMMEELKTFYKEEKIYFIIGLDKIPEKQ